MSANGSKGSASPPRSVYTTLHVHGGCFDLLLDGRAVGRLEAARGGIGRRAMWRVVFADGHDRETQSEAFTDGQHEFRSFAAAADWLGLFPVPR